MKQCSVLNSSALELENRYKEDSIPKVVYIFVISKTKYRLLFLEMLTKFSFTAAGEYSRLWNRRTPLNKRSPPPKKI